MENYERMVYEGFDITYKNIGVDFDKNYYESETYLLGKEIVDLGIKKMYFIKKKMVLFGLICQMKGWTKRLFYELMEPQYT